MSDFEQEEYYVHRKGSFVGNAPMFWAKGGNGYTSYIQGAERFSENDANQLHKEDPSKWKLYKCSEVDARLHLVYDVQDDKRLGTDSPCGWPWGYAAIASMHGEAVQYQWYEEDTGYGWVNITKEAYDQAVIIGNCLTRKLFTYPPSAASKIAELQEDILNCSNENVALRDRIKELEQQVSHWQEQYGKMSVERDADSYRADRLQKELEEARKVPDGYALVPIEPDLVQVNAAIEAINGNDDLETDIRVAYKAMLSAAPDAAIRQIGGGE